MGANLVLDSEVKPIDTDSIDIECKLVHDNGGQFVGLVPDAFTNPRQGRELALLFANELIKNNPKGYDSEIHHLLIPNVPKGATDVGLHVSIYNATFDGGEDKRPLTNDQIDKVNQCTKKFILNVSLTDYKVLVGSPSNDEYTGVIGYVGLIITNKSMPEYMSAMDIIGHVPRTDKIPHVTICGWRMKQNNTQSNDFTQERIHFGLITKDGELYKDNKKFYADNVFPKIVA